MSRTITGAEFGTKVLYRARGNIVNQEAGDSDLSEQMVPPGESFTVPDAVDVVRVYNLTAEGVEELRPEDAMGGPNSPSE